MYLILGIDRVNGGTSQSSDWLLDRWRVISEVASNFYFVSVIFFVTFSRNYVLY